ncbi:hypothetical protein BC938DRAFT_475282 [Jimgerdemannia flammicorona]|uniref:Uncharacterized protein n=1 Tax=Jimgerdemannia flammicorona TaxID=994334 RepID=A0A433QRQ7_9FUNG|nr:hypothetical protein BC938DRAFT_475282 [Jimgerdemannia flammicorona]
MYPRLSISTHRHADPAAGAHRVYPHRAVRSVHRALRACVPAPQQLQRRHQHSVGDLHLLGPHSDVVGDACDYAGEEEVGDRLRKEEGWALHHVDSVVCIECDRGCYGRDNHRDLHASSLDSLAVFD